MTTIKMLYDDNDKTIIEVANKKQQNIVPPTIIQYLEWLVNEQPYNIDANMFLFNEFMRMKKTDFTKFIKVKEIKI